jgi:RND superfamily putative drug exporter
VLSPDGNGARYGLILGDDPLGAQAVRRLGDLQGRVPRLLREAGLPAATASLAGDTALVRETIDRAAQDIPRILPAVLLEPARLGTRPYPRRFALSPGSAG